MNVIEGNLSGLKIIEPKVFGDNRGYFFESWQQQRYQQLGISDDFVQANVSKSQRGVLRGLHFQQPNAQGKLVYVLSGEVFDVAVDIRRGSPTFGQYQAVVLSDKNHRQFYLPKGFAHGFCVLSETAIFAYMCTDYYQPQAEQSLLWNDPQIAIEWPLASPELSEKDRNALTLEQFNQQQLPEFKS